MERSDEMVVCSEVASWDTEESPSMVCLAPETSISDGPS